MFPPYSPISPGGAFFLSYESKKLYRSNYIYYIIIL